MHPKWPVYELDDASSSTVATSVRVKEVWVGGLAERVVLLWGGGAVGSTKKSEGKGRTRERKEVRLVRAQTWAKDAGGDAHLFSVITSLCGGEGQQGRG
jgi:hypothetical protein